MVFKASSLLIIRGKIVRYYTFIHIPTNLPIQPNTNKSLYTLLCYNSLFKRIKTKSCFKLGLQFIPIRHCLILHLKMNFIITLSRKENDYVVSIWWLFKTVKQSYYLLLTFFKYFFPIRISDLKYGMIIMQIFMFFIFVKTFNFVLFISFSILLFPF